MQCTDAGLGIILGTKVPCQATETNHDFLLLTYTQSVEISLKGQPGWLSGLAPPAAQGMILETLDRVPRRALCMEPASPSAYVSASLSVSLMNK